MGPGFNPQPNQAARFLARMTDLGKTIRIAAISLLVLISACAEDQARGDAVTEVGSGAETSSSSTSTEEITTTSESSTTTDETPTTVEPSTTTEPSTTSASTTNTPPTTPSTTVPPVAAGLPTADDVALQYQTLCIESDSRDLAEKWFEPGVLDDLRCSQATGSGTASQARIEFYGCDPIADAAGDASHGCFFGYEGGGYTILVGDLGRGYRGLAATFVID